jgi:putative membrane protein
MDGERDDPGDDEDDPSAPARADGDGSVGRGVTPPTEAGDDRGVTPVDEPGDDRGVTPPTEAGSIVALVRAVGSGDSPREYAGIYLRGVAMGAADAVPGVSGGTIALVTGIYERLVDAITDLDPWLLTLLPRLNTAAGRAELRRELAAMDLGFLLALGLGVLTALVTVSRVMEVALEEFTALTFAFFFGLILASAVVLYGEVSLATPRRAAAAAVGLVVGFVLTGELTAVLPTNPVVALLAGGIAVSAMILPGISGSFLLLVLGQYGYAVRSLSGFTDALVALDTAGLRTFGTVVVAFGIGGVVGLLTIARVIEYALEHHRAATLAFLVSLMVGALRLPVERILDSTGSFDASLLAGLVLAAVVGGALVIGVDRATGDIL